MSQLEVRTNFYHKIPCDGPYNKTVSQYFNATIGGQVYRLELPELKLQFKIDNGRIIFIWNFKIEHETILGKLLVSLFGKINGERCADDTFQEIDVLIPSTPFDCSGNNYPDTIRAELANSSIIGECSSQCSAVELEYQVDRPRVWNHI